MLRSTIIAVDQQALRVVSYNEVLEQFELCNEHGHTQILDAELLLNGAAEYDNPVDMIGKTIIVDLTAEVTLH